MQTPIYSTPNHTFSTHDLPYESFAREVYAHNGDFLAKVYGRTIEECEANAKAITDGCNAFPDLVEALTARKYLTAADNAENRDECGFNMLALTDMGLRGTWDGWKWSGDSAEAFVCALESAALHSLKSEG